MSAYRGPQVDPGPKPPEGSAEYEVWLNRLSSMLRAKYGDKKERSGQLVYFIAAGAFVKIGIAINPRHRLVSMQVHNPLTLMLLHHELGGAHREAELHRLFSHLRVRGEWFRLGPEIQAYIREQPK